MVTKIWYCVLFVICIKVVGLPQSAQVTILEATMLEEQYFIDPYLGKLLFFKLTVLVFCLRTDKTQKFTRTLNFGIDQVF